MLDNTRCAVPTGTPCIISDSKPVSSRRRVIRNSVHSGSVILLTDNGYTDKALKSIIHFDYGSSGRLMLVGGRTVPLESDRVYHINSDVSLTVISSEDNEQGSPWEVFWLIGEEWGVHYANYAKAHYPDLYAQYLNSCQ